MGNVNRYAARGTILWTPDPDLKISLTGDFSHIDERALPGVLLGLVPNIPFTPVPSSRSEEHTSELQSLMRISYAVFCLKKKKHKRHPTQNTHSDTHKHTTNI